MITFACTMANYGTILVVDDNTSIFTTLEITSELIDQLIILASDGYNTGASGGGGGSDNNDLRWDGVTQDYIERAIYLHAKSKKGLSV